MEVKTPGGPLDGPAKQIVAGIEAMSVDADTNIDKQGVIM